MSAKRALVVDDSRSARAFLAKLLQEQQVEVDAADSAEEAIEYLTRIRPDVIFMDHLMPGMDGFQAVQAIKSNPRTADIPVLMYTSQEGELYLGQARALGAVGVLPKNMEQADVRRVLQQLDLGATSTPTLAAQPEVLDAAVAAAATVDSQVVPVLQGPFFEEMLRDEVAALRQHVSDALAAHGRRVTDDMRGLLREVIPPAVEPPPPPVIVPEPPRHSPLAWLVAVAASIAAAALGTLFWRGEQDRGLLRTELADARATITLLTARLSAPAPASVALPATSGGTVVLPIAFGDAPLGGARVEQLREFVTRVAALGQAGTVEVRRHAGRFCFADSGAGYVLAEAATPVSQCALVAEATDPALARGTPETAAFASALAELRQQFANQKIVIDVGVDPADSVIPYPEAQGTPPREPTAGEWNAVAEQNNRVVMRWLPAP